MKSNLINFHSFDIILKDFFERKTFSENISKIITLLRYHLVALKITINYISFSYVVWKMIMLCFSVKKKKKSATL